MARDSKDYAGIYSTDYFSGSQVALYIGDVLVDEVTAISYQVQQQKKPLYGYADEYFRAVSKGQILVQGQFSINFKEAGYLFLILDRYQTIMHGKTSFIKRNDFQHKPSLYPVGRRGPFSDENFVLQESIEAIINNDKNSTTAFKRLEDLKTLAGMSFDDFKNKGGAERKSNLVHETSTKLRGFSSEGRAYGGVGTAENIFEAFEDAVWKSDQTTLNEETRRADDSRLNPFDIFLTYGDHLGDNTVNHTIRKIAGVHILGSTQQIGIDGLPIQETYSFIARNIV
jgi:hypothetical protein